MPTLSWSYGTNIILRTSIGPETMEGRLRNCIDVPEEWVIKSAQLQEHLTQARVIVAARKAPWVTGEFETTAILAVAASLAYNAYCDHADSHVPSKIDKTGYWKHEGEVRTRENRAAKASMLAGNADKWLEMISKNPGMGPRLEMM